MGDALQEVHLVKSGLDPVRLGAGNQVSRKDLIRTKDRIKKERLLIIEQELCFQLTLWGSFLSLAGINKGIRKGLEPITTSNPHGYPKFPPPYIRLVLKNVNYLQLALQKSRT